RSSPVSTTHTRPATLFPYTTLFRSPGRPAGPAQRPAPADREGLRLGEGLRAARDLAADLRWLRLHAGLPDRAVHPRRQDRHPLRSEEHTSELQSRVDLVCRLLLEKK